MNDLISRSALIKVLKARATNEAIMGYMTAYDVTNSIIDEVEEQPTAYDIDKVVEELEKATQCIKINEKPTSVKAIHPTQAIEIVKQGVASDDVCEYKIKDKMIYASCNNKQIASAFCWFNECGDYKYCPYCGKKIKEMESD